MIMESVLAVALSVAVDPGLKCPRTHHLPGFPEGSAVVLIDGEIHGTGRDFSWDDIDPSDIERIDIWCWNPDTDALPASEGVQLVLVTTKSIMRRAEAETLAAARLVREFVTEHGEVPTSLEQLGPGLAGYSVEVDERGWTLTSADIESIACATTALGSMADKVDCRNTHSVAKRTLREAWERGSGEGSGDRASPHRPPGSDGT